MLSKRWDEIKDKLHAALELEPPQRSLYLQKIAEADAELGLELESLVASHERASTDFLNTSPLQGVSNQQSPHKPDLMIGRRLGNYEVVELIGTGGMGEVYRAFRADDQYRMQVAIKLIRAGQDSSFVVTRFKNERQILASLDHSNIARVLDGGTTEEGMPYFVMELIEGQPIDEYCDSHKLSTAAFPVPAAWSWLTVFFPRRFGHGHARLIHFLFDASECRLAGFLLRLVFMHACTMSRVQRNCRSIWNRVEVSELSSCS